MSESKKWGRIPATLVEVDQARCSLRHGFDQCGADPQNAPCFNTLSTCQALDDYRVSGSTEALDVTRIGAVQALRYRSNFVGRRREGIYVSFIWRPDLSSYFEPPRKIIELAPWVTISLVWQSGNTRGSVIIDGPEGSVSVPMAEQVAAGNRSERLRVYIDNDGSVDVNGIRVDTLAPLPEEQPSELVIHQGDYGSGHVYISDLAVYDYNPETEAARTIYDPYQKGDLQGDSVFYAHLDRASKLQGSDGTVPVDASGQTVEDLSLISATGLEIGGTGKTWLDGQPEARELLEPPLTLRFTERDKSSELPVALGATPSLVKASTKPAVLSVGGTNENVSPLGSRDQLTAEFMDHPDSDIKTDPYRKDRPYNPFEQGTFWGKWAARNEYRQGYPVRKVSGYALEDGGFERHTVYNYVLDRVAGPDANGRFTITAFDILQSLKADRAVYPAPSPGRLRADIDENATSLRLDPYGIGSEYPSGSFRVRVGGEGMDVTRSGDTLTINSRGLYGGRETHSKDDSVQVVARIDSQRIHDIAYTIITGALPELAANIPKDKWNGTAEAFLPRKYSADITEPTGVEDLISELTQTAPIYFFADVRTNQIEMEVIREPDIIPKTITEQSNIAADSVDLKEHPKERIDEVWVYYHIRDAAGDVDKEENYSQRFILANPEEQARRGRRSIKRIFTRWIVAGARDTAEEIAEAYLSRFARPPVRVTFDLDAGDADIWLGDVARVVSRQKQDTFGNPLDTLNYQVTSVKEVEDGHRFRFVAQTLEFIEGIGGGDPGGVDTIKVTIQPDNVEDEQGAVKQINLRSFYDEAIGAEIENINFVIAGGPGTAGGTVAGAKAGQNWSLYMPNNWPWYPNVTLRLESGAAIVGRGGKGGRGSIIKGSSSGGSYVAYATGGSAGTTAFLVRYPLALDSRGLIAGGGGGGGGSGANAYSAYPGETRGSGSGGGGAGKVPGPGGDSTPGTRGGSAGSTLSGGSGSNSDGFWYGGKGGNIGVSGSPGETTNGGNFPGAYGGAGGAAGAAIDGISYVTYTNRGDIRGREI